MRVALSPMTQSGRGGLTARARLCRVGMALALPLALGACVQGASSGLAAQATAVQPGLHQITLDGMALQGEIRAGRAGLQLTRDGARPVAGNEIRVSRQGGLGRDQGALAKKAARATCETAGGRFNSTAIGGFDRAGGWTFPGGCA